MAAICIMKGDRTLHRITSESRSHGNLIGHPGPAVSRTGPGSRGVEKVIAPPKPRDVTISLSSTPCDL